MTDAAPRTGYAPVNGLQMYYELHGAGSAPPLLLLHGAFMTIELEQELIAPLSAGRQVIAVELQGHGRTADIDRPLSYEQLADDAAALLRHLDVASADVYGYSLGGGVALQLAMRHGALVRKLVVVSASYTSAGQHPEVLGGIQHITPEQFDGTPLRAAYDRVAPDPAGFATLVERITRATQPYAWPADAVRAIPAPTLIVVGDSDGTRLEHAVELFQLRGGGVFGDFAGLPASRLAVLPGTTHYGIVMRSALIAQLTAEFLDA
jgi:pimeloyl-ACP methyl ester carboxylesterase